MKTTSEKEKKLDLALSKLKNLDLENPNLKNSLKNLDNQKNQLEIEKKEIETKYQNLVQDYDSGDEDDLDDEELSEDEELEENKSEQKEGENPSRLLVELDIEDNRDDDDFLQVGETDKTDKRERKAYKKPDRGESQWMQQFMQNNNYKIAFFNALYNYRKGVSFGTPFLFNFMLKPVRIFYEKIL